tara:strand:+ start:2376 stop:2639 length:264 start_codon:yes stop_codon:yes gene_type:complete
MKAWLKGGLIAGGIDIIFVILALITSSPKEADLMVLHYVQFPLTFISNLLGYGWIQSLSILIIVGLALWFAIGAIIGLIIGKVKSKK